MELNEGKIVEACKDMKRLYGMPEAKVKAALSRLLRLYGGDQYWGFIEGNNYETLFENCITADHDQAPHQCKDYSEIEKKSKKIKLGASSHDQGDIKGKKPAAMALVSWNELSQEQLPLAVVRSDLNPLELVSSDNGEVKIFVVSDSLDKYFGKMPSLDEFLKIVEDKVRKKYGISDPKFCVKKLMREVCQSYLTVSTNELLLPPMLGISKKSGARSNNRPSMSSVDYCSDKSTKNPNFIEDISRGEERIPISLVNDNGTLELPKFFYISKNALYKNAHVNSSLARISDDHCCLNCSGDCLSAPENCGCTSETRGDFAYTASELLNEKFLEESVAIIRRKDKKLHLYYCTESCPLENSVVKNGKNQKRKRPKRCQGHLVRKFIKECWARCGCGWNCGNRVVQRGITVKLQVFPTSDGKGWGVRTLETLEKGTFVCEYVGEIVTNQELDERNKEFSSGRHTYPVYLDADWAAERHLKDDEALCLDATNFGNIARFINHRCHDANLIEIPVEIETPDHHYYHIAFFTTRKVEANEELNWDYGIDFSDTTHPIEAFECKCGSIFCSTKFQS